MKKQIFKISDNIKNIYSKGENVDVLTEGKNNHLEVLAALLAMIIGVLAGVILKMTSGSFADNLLSYVFVPFRTLFVDALRILIGPIVFFAMVCCVSQFKSIAEIGKIGVKLLGLYMFTTILAVCIGFTLFHLFPVGDKAVAKELSSIVDETLEDEEERIELNEATELATGDAFSIRNIVTSIIPDNPISPFRDGNLLQILFMAILVGIIVSLVSNKFPFIKSFFEILNEIFMFLMKILCKLIPIAIFCNMACLVYETGIRVLKSVSGFMILALFGIACMMLIYGVLIMLFARINPIPFYKKYGRTAITALSLSSSTAAMPYSMKSCEDMGIPDKITSFAIPLGSTINMDGSSLVMSIACLFMARIFNINITPALLVSILISVVLLSLGAPSMAGADLAIIAILISQIGVPVYAIALIMGIDTILDMCQAMSNTTGDAAVALIVAKRMDSLDMDKYYDAVKVDRN